MPPTTTLISPRPGPAGLRAPCGREPVRAREDPEADHVHVLLDRLLHDLLGRALEPGVDDLHPGVAQGLRHHLGPAIVAVQAGLGDQDAHQHDAGLARPSVTALPPTDGAAGSCDGPRCPRRCRPRRAAASCRRGGGRDRRSPGLGQVGSPAGSSQRPSRHGRAHRPGNGTARGAAPLRRQRRSEWLLARGTGRRNPGRALLSRVSRHHGRLSESRGRPRDGPHGGHDPVSVQRARPAAPAAARVPSTP